MIASHRTALLAGLLLAAALAAAPVVHAATVTWDLDADTTVPGGSNEWNTTAANWIESGTPGQTFTDGDDVVFNSEQPPQNAEAVFIGTGGTPHDVAIGSMLIAGQHSETWVFSGGDITGTGKLTYNSNRPVVFTQENLSFSGGTELVSSSGNGITFRPSNGGSHEFGTGPIYLHSSRNYFAFDPQTSGAVLHNNLIVEDGQTGLYIDLRNGSTLDGTLTLGGTLELGAGAPLLADTTLSSDATITYVDSAGARRIDTDIDGQGVYSLTLAQAVNANTDWRIVVNDDNAPAAGWDIKNLIKTTTNGNQIGAVVFDVDERQFFDTLTGNGGKVILDEGSAEFKRSNTIDVVFHLVYNFTQGTAQGLNGNTGLDIHDGGSLTGSGTVRRVANYYGHGTPASYAVTVDVENDGTLGPGDGVGTLGVLGDVTFKSGGVFAIELAGLNSGQFDVLSLLSDASGGGTLTFQAGSVLTVATINGFTPGIGQSWQIATADSIIGASLIQTPLNYALSSSGGTLTLTFIPEPGTGMLVLLGLGGLLMLPRGKVVSD